MPERKRFAGRRAAVTGAGGFIGGAIARALAAEGAEVTGIDVPGTEARIEEAGAEPRIADVTHLEEATGALQGAELVVHAAAYVREWGTMEEFVEVNVRGTATMLDAADAAGTERFVQISSVVVYGYDDPREQGEEAFRRVCGIPYIDTKSASDRLAARRGAIVVRPGDVYGPGSIPWIVRGLEMARAGSFALPAPGEGIMLPVYIDDLVEAVLLALEKGKPGRTYTAWDGRPVPFREYYARIAEIAGARPPRTLPRPVLELAGAAMEAWSKVRGRPPLFTARAPTFLDRQGTVSAQRARDELGWEPRVTLEEGLSRSAEWARAEGLLDA